MSNLLLANSVSLRQVADSASEIINAALQDLLVDEPGFDSKLANTIEVCVEQIEMLGDAAGFAGFNGLKLTCERLGQYLDELRTGNAFMTVNARQLLEWTGDILNYCDDPSDISAAGMLINPLPVDYHLEVRTALAKDAITCRQAVSDDNGTNENNDAQTAMAGFPLEDTGMLQVDDAQDDFEFIDEPVLEDFEPVLEDLDTDMDDLETLDIFGPDAQDDSDEADSILGMLSHELSDVTPQLAEYATQICQSEDTDQLFSAISAYQEILGRILMVCEEFNLEGIKLIGEFVDGNLLRIAEKPQSERQTSLRVLQGWPETVIAHLASPEDDKLCIAVVDYLEHTDWPEPLPYTAVRDLLEGLTRELEISGEITAEERVKTASAEDVALDISSDANQDLVAAFFTESPGHAERFSTLIQAISAGKDVHANTEAAQRIAHTLKGSANLVGINGIANLAHHLEDIFEYLAKKKLTPPATMADTMLEAADCIEAMLDSLQAHTPPPHNAQAILQGVLDWANLVDQGEIASTTSLPEKAVSLDAGPDSEAAPPSLTTENDKTSPETDSPAQTEPMATPASVKVDSVHVPAATLDHIFRLVGETSIAMSQMQERLTQLRNRREGLRQLDAALQQRRLKLENQVSVRGMAAQHRIARAVGSGIANEHFDPLEMDEYDEFYSSTHAYIESVSDLRAMSRNINEEIAELEGLFRQQKHLNKELQQVVISTRMMPVSTIAGRLHRSVRQACRATNKKAELHISGEDLLLDGDVLNQLADPLMHILRNAVDHGIEEPGERFEQGKPDVGIIQLDFKQEGNNVVVECHDDGQGLDYARIRSTAVKRGLLNEHEQRDNAALARLILQSGFSTRDKATHISGRGVGMDVVNTTVQKLKGNMDISDADTGGTRISIRLPITLLTSHCLLVSARDKVYAIATSSLDQILPPGLGEFSILGEGMTFRLGNDVYPVHSLDGLLSASTDIDLNQAARKSVLLVKADTGLTAVVINQVIASSDLVVKGMGRYIDRVHGVSGVATLGDGNVVAVLDLPEMLRSPANTRIAVDHDLSDNDVEEESTTNVPKIMVVDDSLSVRQSLSQLIGDVGYSAIVARDGMEAVELLAKQKPDVMLVDMEMPRMNGLELTTYVRGKSELKSIPVVMITSRTTEKHRQQADKAGVNIYLNKPYTEDDVVSTIESFLQ